MFRYYLLGGDTEAPSGLYARLCHAFLVCTGSGAVRRAGSDVKNLKATFTLNFYYGILFLRTSHETILRYRTCSILRNSL